MSAPGVRPGVLVDLGQPQVVAVTSHVTAGLPSLSLVVMLQEAAHDDNTIAFSRSPWRRSSRRRTNSRRRRGLP